MRTDKAAKKLVSIVSAGVENGGDARLLMQIIEDTFKLGAQVGAESKTPVSDVEDVLMQFTSEIFFG